MFAESKYGIHYAKLETSPRLQRMLKLLCTGERFTTRDIVMQAEIMAVGTAASELRANGIQVQCKAEGQGRYVYWLDGYGLRQAQERQGGL
ncbi:MAG: hypothetical protein KAY24_19535 [Candidatus Eisenbacteria sp.]|nr:hypothetical protein [Candidatus Eisenbacteria bacterium]